MCNVRGKREHGVTVRGRGVGGMASQLDTTTATDGGGVNETVIIRLCVLVWLMERW